jgi:hypothetical protein
VFEADGLDDSIVFDDQDSLDVWAEQQFTLEEPASNEIPLFNSAVTSSANADTTTICYGMVGFHRPHPLSHRR